MSRSRAIAAATLARLRARAGGGLSNGQSGAFRRRQHLAYRRVDVEAYPSRYIARDMAQQEQPGADRPRE
jgi:hypothetical protein